MPDQIRSLINQSGVLGVFNRINLFYIFTVLFMNFLSAYAKHSVRGDKRPKRTDWYQGVSMVVSTWTAIATWVYGLALKGAVPSTQIANALISAAMGIGVLVAVLEMHHEWDPNGDAKGNYVKVMIWTHVVSLIYLVGFVFFVKGL